MVTAAIGIGTNLGEREMYLRNAVQRLRVHVADLRCSPVYDTAPFGMLDQPRFLNMVVMGSTALAPHAFVAAMQTIEYAMGRHTRERNGPREIDLDLLLYGDTVIRTPALTIPHPGLHERTTVLLPLADIAPSLVHPTLGVTIAQLLARVDATTCVPWPMRW